MNATSPYGVHRDEFLYMAMGRHLRLWRMDFPPFIAMAAQLSRMLGDSLIAIRIIPAIAAALLVALAARLAAQFGGGRGAQRLAAVAVVASPLFLRAGSLFQPVILDQLWWTLGYVALAHLAGLADGDASAGAWRRWWIILGAITGVGLLTKFSIAFFGVGVLVAVLSTPLRRALRTPWPWLAVVLALAIGSPSVVGQVALHFPVLGQMHDLQSSQLQRVTPAGFLGGQLLLGPAVLLALGGLLALLVGPLHRYRAVGVATLTTFVLLLALHGKSYYVGPIYPVLFAAGAAAFDVLIARASMPPRARRLAWTAPAVLVVAFGLAALPFGLPILPPAAMARYASALGPRSAVTTNSGEVSQLPQDFADMLGWPAQTEAMVRVYRQLSPAEREGAVIAAGNYGEAGALDFYGRRFGLPATISSAGSYWFFGPGARRGEPTLVLAGRDAAEDLGRLFRRVQVVAEVRPAERRWLVSEEQDVVVFRCDSARVPIQQAWPSLAGRN